MAYVGIDLGTTTTGIAVYNLKTDKPEMLGDDKKLFPSVVRMSTDPSKPPVVGRLADQNLPKPGQFRVSNAKRIIGRRLNDKNVDQIRKLFSPLTLIADRNGQAVIRLKSTKTGTWRDVKPEQVSAHVLKHCVKMYENRVASFQGVKAVITVPAKFNEGQRNATKDAATIAGIDVMELLPEPTAAAISYLLRDTQEPDGNYLVFDFGGGTLDVSLVEKKDINITVKGIEGDTLLGGEDIDNLLFEYMVEKLTELQIPMTIKPTRSAAKNRKVLRKRHNLMKECKQAKEVLSDFEQTDIYLETYYDDDDEDEEDDAKITLTREIFDNLLNRNLIHKIMDPVKEVLTTTGTTKSSLKGILLAGGSSRIPLVRKKIEEFFPGIKVYKSKNPDWVVTEGAAIYAKYLGDDENNDSTPSIVNVVPDNFGVEVVGGFMSDILKKNSPLPATNTRNYTTVNDNQTSVCCALYQGPHEKVADNVPLYTTNLYDIPPLPKGEADIQMTMTLDKSGILQYSAICKDSNSSIETEIPVNVKGRLSEEDLEKLKEGEDIPSMEPEIDEKIQELIPLLLRLENVINESVPLPRRGQYTGRLETLHSIADNCRDASPEDIQNRIDVANKLLQGLLQSNVPYSIPWNMIHLRTIQDEVLCSMQ